MKKLKHLSLSLISFFLLTGFCHGQKLTQQIVDKAIRLSIDKANASPMGSKIHMTKVLSITPLNFTSDSTASCQVETEGFSENSGRDKVSFIACTQIETKFTIEYFFIYKEGRWKSMGGKFASKILVSREYMRDYARQNIAPEIPVK